MLMGSSGSMGRVIWPVRKLRWRVFSWSFSVLKFTVGVEGSSESRSKMTMFWKSERTMYCGSSDSLPLRVRSWM